MLTGNWKNFEELELHLTLQELELLVLALRKQEHRHHKFLAALKGHDLGEFDDGEKEDIEDITHRVKIRAAAKLRNMEPEEYELRAIGFGFD